MTTYVDSDKHQKHFHYEHQTRKLNHKDYDEFEGKKFHNVRKNQHHKDILKAIGRVGLCVNDKPCDSIPVADLDNVCFILCNTYEHKNVDLGVGPLNDTQMIGVNMHRRGFKVFYLVSPRKEEFINYCQFFSQNTQNKLVIFYTGRGFLSDGEHTNIMFNDGNATPQELGQAISQANTSNHIVLITDCCTGGSAFDVRENPHDIVSLGISKPASEKDRHDRRTHGIFTYYLCKILNEAPDITPAALVDRMNPPLKRFDASLICHETNPELDSVPLF